MLRKKILTSNENSIVLESLYNIFSILYVFDIVDIDMLSYILCQT
jgi:hypothetical protein